MAKQWALTSRSADSEETISVFACVETVVCSAAWFWLVSLWGFKWAAWSLAITPVVLFRTENSTARGVVWMRACLTRAIGCVGKIGDTRPAIGGLAVLLLILSGSVLVLLVRFLASLREWFRDPVSLIRGMPANWSSACFVRDSASPLVALPGAESIDDHDVLALVAPGMLGHRFGEGLRTTEAPGWTNLQNIIYSAVLVLLVYIPFIGPITVLALAYRYALKSTAAVYLPLIFIVKGVWHEEAKPLLKSICELAISRVQRIAAALVLAGFLAKVLIYSLGIDVMTRANGYIGTRLVLYFDQRVAERFAQMLRTYVAPYSLPGWQLMSAANALLTWVIYFYANKLLTLYTPNTRVTAIRWLKFISALLSLYTIAALVVITWREADFNLPPVGDWFPSTGTEPAE